MFLIFIFFCAVPAMAEPVQITLNTMHERDDFHTEGARRFAELVGRYSKQSIKISVRHGGAMGIDESDLLRAVRDGELEISDIRMDAVEKSAPVFGLSAKPFLVQSFEKARAFYEVVQPFYQKAAEAWNQKILYVSPSEPSGLFSKGTVDDVKPIAGMKVGVNGPVNIAFLGEFLQVEPRSIEWYEAAMALDDGDLNAVLAPASVGAGARFWRTSLNYTPVNYSYPLNMVTINLDLWNSLSGDMQTAIEKAARLAGDWQWKDSQTKSGKALTDLSSRGVGIYDANSTLKKQLHEAGQRYFDRLGDSLDPEIIAAVRKFFAGL